MDEEKEYYLYIKKLFCRWAPIYDVFVDIFVSGVRQKVVDFTNAKNASRILDVATGTGKTGVCIWKKGL